MAIQSSVFLRENPCWQVTGPPYSWARHISCNSLLAKIGIMWARPLAPLTNLNLPPVHGLSVQIIHFTTSKNPILDGLEQALEREIASSNPHESLETVLAPYALTVIHTSCKSLQLPILLPVLPEEESNYPSQ